MKLKASAMRSTIIGSVLLLAGCASQPQVVYRTVPLPLPPRPMLPKVTGPELSCLTDATYHKLVIRQRLRREYAEKLRGIIEATHGK